MQPYCKHHLLFCFAEPESMLYYKQQRKATEALQYCHTVSQGPVHAGCTHVVARVTSGSLQAAHGLPAFRTHPTPRTTWWPTTAQPTEFIPYTQQCTLCVSFNICDNMQWVHNTSLQHALREDVSSRMPLHMRTRLHLNTCVPALDAACAAASGCQHSTQSIDSRPCMTWRMTMQLTSHEGALHMAPGHMTPLALTQACQRHMHPRNLNSCRCICTITKHVQGAVGHGSRSSTVTEPVLPLTTRYFGVTRMMSFHPTAGLAMGTVSTPVAGSMVGL